MKKLFTLLLTVLIAASSASAVKMTIKVDDPEAITATYYDASYNTVCRTLEGTESVFDVESGKSQRIYANNGYVIKSCTDDAGKTYTAYDMGRYVEFQLTDDRVITFTTGSDASLRDESFTLTLDDPASVIVTRAGNTLYGLKAGDNLVRFDQWEDENEIRVRHAVYNMPLGDVSVNGTSQGAGKTSYTIYVNDGDKVDVKATPDKPVADPVVTIKANDPAYITSVTLNNGPVELTFADGTATFEAKMGDRLSVTGDQNAFKLDNLYVDGSAYWSTAATYTTNVTKDLSLEFEVTRYRTITAYIDVDDPANVKVLQGYSYNGNVIDLEAGEQEFTFSNKNEADARLTISAQADCRILSVSLDGKAVNESYGSYSVTLGEGSRVVIRSERIVRDKQVIVYRDDTSLIDSFTFRFADNTYKYGFRDGYTTVDFCDRDLPIYCSWDSEDIDEGTAEVYLDDALLERENPARDRFNINPGHQSVLKIFHNGPAEFHALVFDIDENVGEVTAVRDLVKAIGDLAATTDVHAGTRVDLTVATPKAVDAVTLNGAPVDTDPDGRYSFVVTAPTTLKITAKSSAGIGDATIAGTTDARVYNLQGICVGTDTRDLPAGLYIIGGKKVKINK